jgi:hypothetical protein
MLVLSIVTCLFCSSCATILCGPVTECQYVKPGRGRARHIRPVVLFFDIILTGPIGVIVDFATCAIYRPCAMQSTFKQAYH